MNRFALPLIVLGLLVTGCGARQPSPTQTGMSDEAILKELAARVDAAGPQISTASPATRHIDYIIRREVQGEALACGYSSLWSTTSSGERRRVGWPTVFVARDRLVLRSDVTEAEFTALQLELCGPDWVGETNVPFPKSH